MFRKGAGKNIVFSIYTIGLHLLLVVVLYRTDFIDQAYYALGGVKPEFMPEYFRNHDLILLKDSAITEEMTLFLGDSMVLGLCAECIERGSLNYAIGRDTVYGLVNRLSRYRALKKSKLVFVAIGTNDIVRRENKLALKYFTELLKTKLADKIIILSAILPVDEELQKVRGRTNARISDMNANLEAICLKHKKCLFFDSGKKLSDVNGNLHSQYHNGDGLHLSNKGYAIWQADIKESFLKIKCAFNLKVCV